MPDLRLTWRPECYHGDGKRPPFFEGWYFKLVDAVARQRFAVIPGVFLADEPGASHSFIQTLDGLTGRTTYHRYPLDAFRYTPGELDIWIGPNHFWQDGISLDITSAERTLQGELHFSALSPWPVSRVSPGIMGPYAFTPFMECYHGVLSLDHQVDGSLTTDGQRLDFAFGRGYIEKDWGQAFPKAWIWMQTNHFFRPGTSFTASIATIPWLRSAFRGFIIGLWHDRRLYRFATYTGASTEHLGLTDTHVNWRVTGNVGSRLRPQHCRLEIIAERSEGGLLHAPYRAAMLQRVLESLTATVAVRLVALHPHGEKVLFDEIGGCAGLEIGGEIAGILD